MSKPEYLTGIGLDSHAFDTTDKVLTLGGYIVSNEIGLSGNSDGDVILHAIFNAISNAIGRRSIGFYADDLCLNQNIKDSKKYLDIALIMMSDSKYEISNISIVLECKKPKIEPISKEIKSSISNILNLKEDLIGLTATSGEELTAFGQGLGIQCFCSVLLIKTKPPFYLKPIFILTAITLAAYLYALRYVFNNMDDIF